MAPRERFSDEGSARNELAAEVFPEAPRAGAAGKRGRAAAPAGG